MNLHNEGEGTTVEIRNLSAFYGTFKAIEGIDMIIDPHSIIALIGPSGCGKSTILRCINRMHEVTPGARVTGQVLVSGVNIYGKGISPTDIRSWVGMVFQKPNPFPTMSIADNVIAGLKLNGIKPKGTTYQEIVESVLTSVGMWREVKDKLHTSGMSLSGGQQQRLYIARAIAVEPKILLMDEPCSALDPASTAKIEELLRELRNKYTIVLVTHNMQQALRVADETAFSLQTMPASVISLNMDLPVRCFLTRETNAHRIIYPGVLVERL